MGYGAAAQVPGGALDLEQVGGWTASAPGFPAGYEDGLVQPQVVVTGDTVIASVGGGLVAGVAADSGQVRWTRRFDRRAVGPLTAGDRALVVIPGSNGAVEWLDPATGEAASRVALPGLLGQVAVDGRRGTVAVAAGDRATARNSRGFVQRVSADGTVQRIGRRALLGLPVAVAPNGTVYTHRANHSVTALTVAGRVRWRLPVPAASIGGDAATAAIAHRPDGDVMVAAGGLLHRVRARPAAAPSSRRPLLRVTPSRTRLAGAPVVCPGAVRGRCTPATARGAVGELRLPRALRNRPIELTLRRRDRPAVAVPGWSLRLDPLGAPRVWFPLDGVRDEVCSECRIPTVAPGRYLVEARWRAGSRTGVVRAPLTVLKPGRAR